MPPTQRLLVTAGAGALSAAAFLIPLHGSAFGLVTAYFSLLPLFLAGLALGVPAVAGATAASLLVTTLGAGLAAVLVFAAAYLLPPLLLVRQALMGRPDGKGGVEWYPSGMLLGWATGIGIALFGVSAAILSMQPEGLVGTLEAQVGSMWDMLTQGEAEDRRGGFVETVVPLLPGMVVASWLLMVVVNGCLAQSLLVRLGHNLRPTPAYVSMELPSWLLPALTLSAAAGLLLPGNAGYIGQNLAVILVVPYCFLGLAVVHVLCRRASASGLLLGMFYGLLILFAWPVILVAGLGLMESWLKLRDRDKGMPPARRNDD